jgi:hypothetical protein
MPRPLQRICLETGLKFDINRAIRDGWITPGARTRSVVQWAKRPAWTVTANMAGTQRGYVRIQIEALDDGIELEARTRHFGGQQWFFLCPYLNRRAMVLWMPPGASHFASRLAWGRRVAYASQFLDENSRAHHGQAKLRRRLCRVGGFNPDEWDLPPKPKWMRWQTYNRAVEKFDSYESILDARVLELAARVPKI